MKIEIWSDIACPFCYIGKRHLEQAMQAYEGLINFEIEWKSYQLQPDLKVESPKGLDAYLAEIKGWSIEQAQNMNHQVTQMASQCGLDYQLDKAIVANTFKAHQLIQYAKTLGKGDLAEEHLFKAYFMQGIDLNQIDQLIQIGLKIGLDQNELRSVLEHDAFSDAVKKDQFEAQQLQVRGVPFFLFDEQYAISGAQPVDQFVSVIKQIAEISIKTQ